MLGAKPFWVKASILWLLFAMGESCFAGCCSCTCASVALAGCCLIFEGCLAWGEPRWGMLQPCLRTVTAGLGIPAGVPRPFHQVAGVAQLLESAGECFLSAGLRSIAGAPGLLPSL